MSQGLDLPQGGFRAPRVPLDLRCVVLAAVGFVGVVLVDQALWKIFGTNSSPVAQLVDLIGQQLDYVAFLGVAFRKAMHSVWGEATYELTPWQTLITAVCFVGAWSFFGGALLRTAALKLTRDDPLSMREALRFGARNWFAFLLAPILVILFAAFFAALNALAGLLFSIPLVGSFLLALPLFPLVLIASLLIVLALMGGVVGLPLMWAGIAVEQNGPLEALSRAFSYIFARPFRFFFSYFLIFVVMSILLLAAQHFERTVKESTKVGVVRDGLDDAISQDPGDPDGLMKEEYLQSDRVRREQEGIARIENVQNVAWYDAPGFVWMWLCLYVFLIGFKGYAIYLFLGGTTSLYLQLRREVDGTDEEEIYPESEADVAPGEPRWVGEPESEAGDAEGAEKKEDE